MAPPVEAQCWQATGELGPSTAAGGARFGEAIALWADTIVVGSVDESQPGPSAGGAYIFERDSGGPGMWGEVLLLTASDGAGGDHFGSSVSIHGDTLAVGASLADAGAGSAYVFERDLGGSGSWGEAAQLAPVGLSRSAQFGVSISAWGDLVVVGASLDEVNGPGSGSAYVFERDEGGPGAWGQVAKLSASDGAAGDGFGACVSLSEDTLVVGALWDDGNGNGPASGSAYVFGRDQGGPDAWGEVVKLFDPSGSANDRFGWSVSVSADTVSVSSPFVDSGVLEDVGAVFFFERNLGGPGGWGLSKQSRPGVRSQFQHFGSSVSCQGDLCVVGSRPSSASGSAHVLSRDLWGPDTWREVQTLQRSSGPGVFGSPVAAGPRTAIVGAYLGQSVYVFDDPPSAPFSTYCTAGYSASGCQAQISSCGTASATAPSGFSLLASGVEGAINGLFYFGANGRQANPWGNGTSMQCVVPPLKRGAVLATAPSALVCGGLFTEDLNARWTQKPNQSPGPGALVQAQLWYRDPGNTSNQTTSLSDALEFVVGP